MSPITPAHQQRRACGGRPSTDTLKGSALPPLIDPPHCVSAGCPCTATYNGEQGEHCCLTCRRGKPCDANYHQHPTRPISGGVPHCATAGCPCPSTWNGQPGEACCRTCQRGRPCVQPYHPSRMIPGQPQGQWPHPPVLPDEDNMDTSGEEPQAPYHLPSTYLLRQTTMRVTYTNYMGPKYHHHMLNTRRTVQWRL